MATNEYKAGCNIKVGQLVYIDKDNVVWPVAKMKDEKGQSLFQNANKENPICTQCGNLTQRMGSCFVCVVCGHPNSCS